MVGTRHGQALVAQNLHIMPQLELSFIHNNVPIKVHFDIVLAWEKPHPAIRILELKSTQDLPETLYTSYEIQLYGQASLMAELWNKKAFILRTHGGTIVHENFTIAEICQAPFCINLPHEASNVDLEAWVLCISISDAKAFGSTVLYYWEWVKWYEDYTEVSIIENFMQSLEPDEYLLVRVGESYEDNAYEGGLLGNRFDLGLVRSVTLKSNP